MPIQNWFDYRPAPPPRQYAEWLHMRADRWRRIHRALYLLAVSGLNIVRELAELLARREGLADPQSFSARRVFHVLQAYRLAESAQLPYLGSTKITVVRLSAIGRQVCAAYGWALKESEWECLLRLHDGCNQPEHTGAVLAFAREARRHAYQVTILPQIWQHSVGALPDVYVTDSRHRRAYVEVEAGHHRQKARKWKNQMALQGFVAVATRTPIQRQRVVAEIQALGYPGKAADLETLLSGGKSPGPLFVERWGTDDDHSGFTG